MSTPKSPRSAKSPSTGPQSPPDQPAAETDAPPTNTQIPFNEDDDNDSAIGNNDRLAHLSLEFTHGGSTQKSIASSTASLSDSILEYRSIHGRTFQSSKTTEYWGPNDDQQNVGLDIAHHFITLLQGDRLFEAPIGDNPSKILDVGTGTGIWAIDVADAYPATEVTGTDISPIQPPWVPPNCKFEIDDAQLEWTFQPDTFDFVHIRALYGSISDWTELYRQAFRAIVPGGWIEDFELNITLHSDTPSIRDDPEHIFKQWANVFLEAMDRIGKTGRIGLPGNMRNRMAEVGFVNIVEKSYQMPVGEWSSDDTMKEIGAYNLAFLDESLEGFALFLLKQIMGWEYAEIQVFVARMRNAIRDKTIRPYYHATMVYAKKPTALEI